MTTFHRADVDLLERLGGSDAVVRRAVIRSTGRVVVAKHASWDRPEVAHRLGREAAVLGRVRHPSLVRLVGIVEDAGGRCLLLDHAPGGSLADVVNAGERPAPADVAELGARLADALHALHTADVVHRDVHPGNVLLDAELHPVLADLDNALDLGGQPLDGDGEVVGHRDHIDHRLLAGAAPEPGNDLHALATTLWTLATGSPPERIDPAEPVQLPDHPAVPPPLQAVLRGCVTGRPADAAAVRAQLQELAASLSEARVAAVRVPEPSDRGHALPPRLPAAPGAARPATTLSGGTRRWGPRPQRPSPGDRPHPEARGRVGSLVATAGIGLLTLVGWAVSTGSGPGRPVPAAPPPVCGTTVSVFGEQVLADLDGDGCSEVVTLRDGDITTPGGSFRVGEPDDVLLAGDWDGDGRWGVGLYRPATGAVYLFDEVRAGATGRPALQLAPHGDPVVVDGPDGHVVRVDPG